ncbi:MAG: hypothetical protein GEV12_13185 [Micromonosporaceae bacterium]|nr:hypothetical protein [Micromonosporaceae bacterium]
MSMSRRASTVPARLAKVCETPLIRIIRVPYPFGLATVEASGWDTLDLEPGAGLPGLLACRRLSALPPGGADSRPARCPAGTASTLPRQKHASTADFTGRLLMRRHTRILTALAAVATMLVASACTGGDGDTGDEDTTPDEVVYITAFGVFGREAYAWVAQEKGYFEEANINVEIQPGTGTGDNIALVASGQAQFATGDMSGVTLLLGNGEIEGITVVGAVHQLSLIGFMSLGDEIQTPQDLEGKSIADSSGSVGRLLFPTYADLVGIDPESVDLVDADPPQLPTLLASGQVDAIGQFSVGVPLIEAAAEGETASFIPYSDEMTDLYGNSLVTSTELAQSDPDLVQRFRDALFRGLEYSIDDPQGAAEILAAADESVVPEVAAAELEIMESYVRQAGVPIGSVDEVRVSQTIALLEATGAIPPGITAEDVITPSLIISG